jgi:hypothetical protein
MREIKAHPGRTGQEKGELAMGVKETDRNPAVTKIGDALATLG